MSNARYYQANPGYSDTTPGTSPLKPLFMVTDHDAENEKMQAQDKSLKRQIRFLRVFYRLLGTILSILVFVPITMTLHIYLSSRNVYKDIVLPDGSTTSRNAWHKDTKTWPTYAYFAVAITSVVLNFIILIAYLRDVRSANIAATVETVFSWVVMLANFVVWGAAVVMYRVEKDTGGVSNDLWGWTCSTAAERIQDVFNKEVNFDKYCNVQALSWYIGILQVAVTVMAAFIYLLVLRRFKLKKTIKRNSRRLATE